MTRLCLAVFSAAVLLSACNHKSTYQSLQRQHLQECDRAPTSDERARCAAEDKLGYEDYSREREALLRGKMQDKEPEGEQQ